MKFLQLTTLLVLSVVLVGGFTLKNEQGMKTEETRELIKLLQNVLKKVSPEHEGDKPGNKGDKPGNKGDKPDKGGEEQNPFKLIHDYLTETEGDIIDTPIYEISDARLTNLLTNMVTILESAIEADKQDVVMLRVLTNFVEYVASDTMSKIWRLVDSLVAQAREENDLLDDVTAGTSSGRRRRSTRSIDVDYNKVIARAKKAMSMKQGLSKEMYTRASDGSQRATSLARRTDVEEHTIHPNVTIYDAVLWHVILPFDGHVWSYRYLLWGEL